MSRVQGSIQRTVKKKELRAYWEKRAVELSNSGVEPTPENVEKLLDLVLLMAIDNSTQRSSRAIAEIFDDLQRG